MNFKVISKGVSGNLLLESNTPKGITHKMHLFYQGKMVAELFDTIGRVERPLYLAKPREISFDLVGKTLESK